MKIPIVNDFTIDANGAESALANILSSVTLTPEAHDKLLCVHDRLSRCLRIKALIALGRSRHEELRIQKSSLKSTHQLPRSAGQGVSKKVGLQERLAIIAWLRGKYSVRGPLFGFKKDWWAALVIAIAFGEQSRFKAN